MSIPSAFAVALPPLRFREVGGGRAHHLESAVHVSRADLDAVDDSGHLAALVRSRLSARQAGIDCQHGGGDGRQPGSPYHPLPLQVLVVAGPWGAAEPGERMKRQWVAPPRIAWGL